MNKEINMGAMHQTLEGYYKVSVVDAKTDKVIWEQPEWKKNLILNQGMDALATYTYAQIFAYAVAGTGTRVNSIDSAAATVSQSGTAITLVPDVSFTSFTGSAGGYANALSAGDTIVFDNGSGGVTHVEIYSSVTGLTAVTKETATIPATEFTIWKTSQVGLQIEVKRTIGYLTGAGNCESTWLSPTMTLRRTWDFAIETGTVYYTEIGTAWVAAVLNTNVFSRILLPSTIQVDTGQKLRMSYELQVTVPTTQVNRPNITITGWPVAPATNTNCTESVQFVCNAAGGRSAEGCYNLCNLSQVYWNGGSAGYYGSSPIPLDPASVSSNCSFFLSNNSQSLQAFNSAVDRTLPNSDWASNTVQSAYTPGSYTVNKVASFTIYQMNRTDIKSMGFGNGGQYNSNPGGIYHPFAILFEQTQSKANTQTLTLAYTWTWGRTYA